MARIRTVKPDFFRHEALQDLQERFPNVHPMLVFAGLWTVADRCGRFEWKPRTLKLDVLPFLRFEMAEALSVLEDAGFIVRYEVEGKIYGFIPTFEEHQRITGKELASPPRYPEPPQGITGETPEKRPGVQEREKEREKERERIDPPPGDSAEPGPPASAPPSPVLVEVPCKGTGAKTWALTQAKLDEWIAAFPGVDVKAEIRKAIQWLRDNPTRGKTARGMPAFFGSWLSREQNRGPRNGGTAHGIDRQHRFTGRDEDLRRQLEARGGGGGGSTLPDVRKGDDPAGAPGAPW